jgi:hypothetical protein
MSLLYGERELKKFKKYLKDFSKRFKIVFNKRFDPYVPKKFRSVIEDIFLLENCQNHQT